jgi:hypothetical protein
MSLEKFFQSGGSAFLFVSERLFGFLCGVLGAVFRVLW